VKPEDIRELARNYELLLIESGAMAVQADRARKLSSDPNATADSLDALSHAAWMCSELRRLGAGNENQRAKMARWLGFIQGVLWTLGVYSIDEMRDHNLGKGYHSSDQPVTP
jgi:hypothetical protein